MPTTPFSDELIARLKEATAWRFGSEVGQVFTPRFFCCTSPNEMGLVDGKEPVALFTLSPNPCFVNETVSYNGSASYDPDGSIVGYDWSFEGHTPATGTAVSGTLVYDTAGNYDIQLVVEDGTGLFSSPARQVLQVKNANWLGFVAAENGVFYSDGINLNLMLSGNAYDVVIDPATQNRQPGSKVVWAAMAGSIAQSVNGGSSWIDQTPGAISNYASDSPAPMPGSLTYNQLLFAGDSLVCLATWQNGSAEWRSWLLRTDVTAAMRAGGSVSWSDW